MGFCNKLRWENGIPPPPLLHSGPSLNTPLTGRQKNNLQQKSHFKHFTFIIIIILFAPGQMLNILHMSQTQCKLGN